MIRKEYYKDNQRVVRPRSIVVNGTTYVPPTDEQLMVAGYDIKEVEIIEPAPYVPTYEEKVVQLIREKYTIDDELAILRQRDSKPEEFAEYNRFVEECKVLAR